MPLRQRILLFTIVVVAVAAFSYRRAKSIAERPVHIPGPAIQVDNRPSLIEIVPAEAKLSPGETRLIFARILNESDRTYRYDSRIFTWKILEASGGSLRPNGASSLYYAFTAPTAPGIYHVQVSLKDSPDVQKTLSIVVGETAVASAPAPAPRKVAAEPAKMAPAAAAKGGAPKKAAKGSNGAALPQ